MNFTLGLLLVLLPLLSAAQHFGGNPPSLKWQQINTDTARIIFPAGLESQGRRVADIIHYLNRNTRSSIGGLQRKVSIVLQNQTLTANGYVQLGPFRSEFYMAPPASSFDLGSLKWEEQLALHEYRHVLQNMNFRQGVSKVAAWIAGDLGQALFTNIAVPDWWWEGDAVVMETALSPQGRGRLPAFFDGFRALTLAGKRYSYMKIRNGSYRDYVPDHYELGYLMNAYGREHYGPELWKHVTSDAVRFRGVFYPFSQSLRRRTGSSVTGFYQAVMQQYQPLWQGYAARKDTTPAAPLNRPARTVTSYRYIYSTGPGRWIALKSNYRRLPGFYLVDGTGQERLVTRPGVGFDDYFSYRNGRLLWTEARYHARWSWKDYSVIKIHDLDNGNTHTLTHRTKYFSPDLSPDGRHIVAAFTSPAQQYGLDIIDAHSGALTKKLPNPENWYYTFPRFTASGNAVISAVRNAQGQMALIRQPLDSGAVTMLTPFTYTVYGAAVEVHDTVYFTASWKDVNNVYAITLQNNNVYQVTDRSNGVVHAAVDEQQQQLAFSEFTAGGYALYTVPVQPRSWKPVQPEQNYHSAWLRPDLKEEGNILEKVPGAQYPVSKYPQAYRIFNFYGLAPSFDDPDYGIALYSNNILNTASASLGYTYNRNEGSSAIQGNFLFGGWFPYLQAGADYTLNRSTLLKDRGRIYWRELNWHGGFTIPLNFSSGLYTRTLSLSSNYNYLKSYPQGDFKFRNDVIQYISSSLVLNHQRARARQHIFSHFGQYLAVQYARSVNNVKAEQLYARLDLYLPGLFPNHNLVLQAAYQEKDTLQQYSFSDNFVYARGYNTPFYGHIYKLAANYHFPIVYPDWGFAHILYLMRLRGNIFYDHSMAHNFRTKQDRRYASTGGELFLDTKIGNTIPFTVGLRYSHLLDQDPSDNVRDRFDLIIPLQQLFSF